MHSLRSRPRCAREYRSRTAAKPPRIDRFRAAVRVAHACSVGDRSGREPEREIDAVGPKRREAPPARAVRVSAPAVVPKNIRPRPPDEDHPQIADERRQIALHELVAGVMAKMISDVQDAVLVSRHGDEVVRVDQRERERRLDEHVQPARQRRDRVLAMQAVGRRDDHRVAQLASQQLVGRHHAGLGCHPELGAARCGLDDVARPDRGPRDEPLPARRPARAWCAPASPTPSSPTRSMPRW